MVTFSGSAGFTGLMLDFLFVSITLLLLAFVSTFGKSLFRLVFKLIVILSLILEFEILESFNPSKNPV